MHYQRVLRRVVVPLSLALGVLAGCGTDAQRSDPPPTTVEPPAEVSYAVPLPRVSDSVAQAGLACTAEQGWFWSGSSETAVTQPTTCN